VAKQNSAIFRVSNPFYAFTRHARDTKLPNALSLREERLAIMVRRSILSFIR
jgi:hypothetical protein